MRDENHVSAPRAVYDASTAAYVDFVGTELSEVTEDAVDRSMLMAFVELVAQCGRGPVADLGCGPGRVAAFLARQQLDVVGIDVSTEILTAAREAHPHIRFEEGRLDDLPFANGGLAGAVCWYSIIYTPPNLLDGTFAEIARVLASGGLVLLGFQAGTGEAAVNTNAHGTGLSLTSYRHDVEDVARRLERSGLGVHATAVRCRSLDHETTPQAFVIARHP